MNAETRTPATRAGNIRRWTLLGFGIGMLVGLIWVGLFPPEGGEVESIVMWRNIILSITGIGFLFGAFKPVSKHDSSEQ